MEHVVQLTEKYYSVNGVRIHTVESGPEDGQVVLFLHGFPEFWFSWRKQIPFFANLGYRVVAPDQRGYNLSSKPASVGAYRVQELIGDMVALIAALGVDKVYLVGHDWGAVIAWGLATYHPHLLHRLVIINVPHPAVMRETLRKQPDQLRRSWYIFFFQLPYLPQWIISFRRYWIMRRSLQKSSLPGTFSEADLGHYVTAWRRPGTFNAMLNWYRAAVRYRNPTSLESGKQIGVPLLILWGAQDIALRAEMAPKSLKWCENGQLRMFPDATHWVQHEKSDEVTSAILDFFRSDLML